MSLKDMIDGVHHTAVCVEDFVRMRDFLVDFLGFEVEGEMDRRDEAPLGVVVGLPGAMVRWGMLRLGGHRLELFKYYRPDGDRIPNRQCDTGYTHLAFQVADVEAVYAKAIAAGYATLSTPQELRGGATKVFYLCGPEDVVFEFIQFRQGS